MVSRGTTQQSSAPYNRRIVLDLIRRHGTISRKEIVELVSLSPQTVAKFTNDLQSIGLVVARRQAVIWSLNHYLAQHESRRSEGRPWSSSPDLLPAAAQFILAA